MIGLWSIVKALIILGLMTFIGMVFFKILYRKKRMNWLILVGGGMATSSLLFLLSLNLLSYVLRGRAFLVVIFIFFLALAIYLVKKMKIDLLSELFFVKPQHKKKLTVVSILTGLSIIFIFIFVGKASIWGDALQYWTIATSFTRGNYPVVMPYQPNFLTVYHIGTYLILGMLHVLTQLDIDKVHSFFTFYILTSIFLLSSGMALKRNYSIACFIPAVLGLIFFGGPIILTRSSYLLAGKDFLNSLILNIPEVITHYPTFDMTIGSIGGGAINTEMLVYMIQIAFSLAVFLLFIYTLVERDKNKPLKDYILLTLLTNLNLSVNEVFFPIQLFLIAAFFIYDYRRQYLKRILTSGIILIVIFSSLFFIIQSSTRDSLFTPSPEAQRFQLIIPTFKNIEQFTNPLHTDPRFRQDIVVHTDGKGTSWYLVDIRILIFLGLALSLISQEIIPLILSLSAFAGLLCEIFISYTFSPWANFRFFSQSHQLMAFAFGFLIIGLLERKKLKPIILIVLLLLLPQVISSGIKVLNVSLKGNNRNYTSINPKNSSLEKISYILPAKSRVLILGFLPDGTINHSLSLDALVRYGLIVPLGPADTKILNIATGIEWYDAATYLDPPSLKLLGVDYLYLEDNALNFLSDRRVKQIKNASYFKPIQRIGNGVLYEVTDNFKALEDKNDPTLRRMVSQIDDNKTVYIDTISGDIRRLMFLSLHKKHAELFGKDYLERFGGDYYMAIEIPFVKITEDTKNVRDVDYAVMRPGFNPSNFIYGQYQKIVETKSAYLWKRKGDL